LLPGTYFARDASYAHEYTDVMVVEKKTTTGSDDITAGNDDVTAGSDDVTGGGGVSADDDVTSSGPAVSAECASDSDAVKLADKDASLSPADSDVTVNVTDKKADSDETKLSAVDSCDVGTTAPVRLMVAARVFVGRYTVGHRTFRKPPPLDPTQPMSTPFDSCVNYVDDPTLFVVFDSSQCYPEYFITYCCRSDLVPH